MIYLRLLLEFLKIGTFTFGGGYAMLPLVTESVKKLGWLTKEQIVDFVAVSESTPGPFAVNISTYVGCRTGGIFGAVFATLGVVLPSFVIILLVSRGYEKFRSNRIVNGLFAGIKPAVIALIASAVISVGSDVFQFGEIRSIVSITNLKSFIIVLIATIMIYKKQHPIRVIVVCAIAGVLSGMF